MNKLYVKETLKDLYQNKKEVLKQDIQHLINKFEKDTGCKIVNISSDLGWNILTFDFSTDIDAKGYL